MKDFKYVDASNYVVDVLYCVCNDCAFTFSDIVPTNYELVCFESSTNEKLFIPTYGKNGYLDLLKKLVPDWNGNDEITDNNYQIFLDKLNNFTPYPIYGCSKKACPICQSKSIKVLKRTTKQNYTVKWLEIDTSLLD